MKKETVLIAAYGTLRSGERNERFCRNAISRRNATISGTLYDTGWGFPAFVPKGKTKVTVELIEIPIRDWAAVDMLESYPRLYDRVRRSFRRGGHVFRRLVGGPVRRHGARLRRP